MIELRNVSFDYRLVDTTASPFEEGETKQAAEFDPQLRDINLSIPQGAVVLLVGASGSGKSTLLRCMNGLVPQFFEGQFHGEVIVQGRNIAEQALHDAGRSSAMIFQNPRTQFFTTTVLAELAFELENRGVAREEIHARVQATAQRAKISHLLDRKLDTLSGGQLQRVACACALVTDVPILLFDEPTSNLDAESIADFRELLSELKALGKTIVVAEHRLHLFKGLVDTVYRLSHGQICQHYSGEEFFALDEQARKSLGLRAFEEPQPSLPSPEGTGLEVHDLQFQYRNNLWSNTPAQTFSYGSMLFPAGKTTILAGTNGAGKSTLARILCGLEPLPRSGKARIQLDGQDLGPKQRIRASGMVMQEVRQQLFSESVETELTLDTSSKLSEQDITELLRQLDLHAESKRHPLSLSGGQAQRLVIAVTIASGKEVLIFDEPTSGVDYRHLRSIAHLIRDLAEQGRVVIVITHDKELIAACGDYQITLTPRKAIS